MSKILNNLKTEYLTRAKLLDKKFLSKLAKINTKYEKKHDGEVILVIEKSMNLFEILKRKTPHQKAFEHFCLKNVWDTEKNCGVLIYVLISSHHIQIIADRAINKKVGQKVWDNICKKTISEFRKKNWQKGLQDALVRTSEIMVEHFPDDGEPEKNELSDKPVVL